MPAYLQDAVGATAQTLFSAAASRDAAAAWVQAAVQSPHFAHARVTAPSPSDQPTGGATSSASNYAMVLSYLARHGAWEHFRVKMASDGL